MSFFPAKGRRIADRYELDALLGEGGMGSVWRATHLSLLCQVAVKLMSSRLVTDNESTARFRREARTTAALSCPHIVKTTDYGIFENTPYIVMELLVGQSLRERLDRGALSVAEVARVASQMARALTAAHQAGLVHRDLKPDNVFLVGNGDDVFIKVLDFGIAKHLTRLDVPETLTHSGALVGTPFYMSPEQAQSRREIDHRSDLWSFGVLIFECLLGRRPFLARDLGSLMVQICTETIPVPSQVGEVPPGFDEWFARALQRDPEKRFQSATEMAASLGSVLRTTSSRLDVEVFDPKDGPSPTKTALAIRPAKALDSTRRLATSASATPTSNTEQPMWSSTSSQMVHRASSWLLVLMGLLPLAAVGMLSWSMMSPARPPPPPTPVRPIVSASTVAGTSSSTPSAPASSAPKTPASALRAQASPSGRTNEPLPTASSVRRRSIARENPQVAPTPSIPAPPPTAAPAPGPSPPPVSSSANQNTRRRRLSF